eukprot:10924878-Prorocentrum_lima.AAC.1
MPRGEWTNHFIHDRQPRPQAEWQYCLRPIAQTLGAPWCSLRRGCGESSREAASASDCSGEAASAR